MTSLDRTTASIARQPSAALDGPTVMTAAANAAFAFSAEFTRWADGERAPVTDHVLFGGIS